MSLTYKYINYLTVTLLNNSAELSSNLEPEPLTEWFENSAAHPIFRALEWLNWLLRFSVNQ